MGGSEPLCPACGQALRTTEISGVSLRVCGQCHGTLLGQIDMIRTLEAMSAELLATVDPDVELSPVGKAAAKVSCPSCGREMARDDYCSAGLAHFDRCEPCRLLWLGADALGTMTMMWARMERRLERTQKATQALLAEADEFVGSLLLGRATRRALMRFL
jgi:Zn-finger nucleic acid-binding protein